MTMNGRKIPSHGLRLTLFSATLSVVKSFDFPHIMDIKFIPPTPHPLLRELTDTKDQNLHVHVPRSRWVIISRNNIQFLQSGKYTDM